MKPGEEWATEEPAQRWYRSEQHNTIHCLGFFCLLPALLLASALINIPTLVIPAANPTARSSSGGGRGRKELRAHWILGGLDSVQWLP